MHQWLSGSDEKALGLRVWGKLDTDEYKEILQRLEGEIQRENKVNLLLEMGELDGVSPGALWEDTKFDMHHFRDIQRLAVVGHSKFERFMTTISKPFTSEDARFFTPEQTDEAWAWVKEAA
ncbi:MAG: STAS/SEC14 domain-containing protein [Candidatus Hydrogenedentes bacterium]|nr:STAS/SEC14 domain-containing protein [Candidatus Hydrogenedentota bacterium]